MITSRLNINTQSPIPPNPSIVIKCLRSRARNDKTENYKILKTNNFSLAGTLNKRIMSEFK